MQTAIIIFDDFTDIDLFLMWDLLARKKFGWDIKILGTKTSHISSNGISVTTHGHVKLANQCDVVLFASGKGTRALLQDEQFFSFFDLDVKKQFIGSICSGALLLAKLGLLTGLTATTHPQAKSVLESFGINVIDKPLVSYKQIATAGGCLSAQYLVAWLVESIYGVAKRKEVLREIAPVNQENIHEALVTASLVGGRCLELFTKEPVLL